MKFKDLLITKVCLGALIATAPLANMYAANSTWQGDVSSNLTDNANWDNNFPGTGFTGTFSTVAVTSFTPSVTTSATLGEILFTTNPIYTFSWAAGPNTLTLDAAGVVNNTTGLATTTFQTFNISNAGSLAFINSASADGGTVTGQVKYNLNTGNIVFNNTSTAASAIIDGVNTSAITFNTNSLGGTATITADATTAVTFNGTSQSQAATITSTGNNDGILFHDFSVAGGSVNPTHINVTNSGVRFLDNSDPNDAVIVANGLSSVDFNTGVVSTGTHPVVTLNDISSLFASQSNTISNLNSTSPGTTVVLAVNQSLTTFEPASLVPDVFAGQIVGNNTSSFIKSGANDPTSILELTADIPAGPANDWVAVSNNGVLIGNTDNLNRDIIINAPGAVQFKQSGSLTNLTYTEVISGNGTLQKEGVDKLIIAPTSDNSLSFTGNTQINAGNFQLDGKIGGGIDVNNGGTLSGTGVAYGGIGQVIEINAGGTISPGDSIGTITLGDYIHNPNAIYNVELNGSSITAVDLIHVTGAPLTGGLGTATLNGGLVNVSSTDGTFLIALPYTIVTADGGLTGQYDSVDTPVAINQYLEPELSYDANNVFLTLSPNFSPFAETRNELAVAEQLDSIVDPSEDLELVLQNLVTLDPSDLNDALDQLSGAQYASLFQVSQLSTRRFLRDLQVPFRLKNANKNCDCECPTNCCVEIWEDVQYGRTYLKGDSNADGYRSRNIDATIGAQIALDQCWTAGIAAYYENDHIDFHLGGKARVNTIIGALYGIYQNECYYLSSDLLFGYSHFNVRRSIEFAEIDRTAHAHPKIWDVTSYTEAGLNAYETSCFSLQPFLGLEFGWYKRNSFSESGADSIDLHAKSKNHWNFDSRLGVRASTTLPWDIVVSADVAWQHRYTSNDNTVTLRFQEFGDDFSIRGPQQRRNGVDGTIFIAKNICGDLNVYAQAIGERWKHFSNYTFVVGIDFKL